MKNIFSIAVFSILVSGCATTYQPLAFSGGYSEFPIDNSTLRVSFEGNGYSNRTTVESYLLYRAAELTVSRGYDWFVLSERQGETHSDSKYGDTKLTSTAVVKMFRGIKSSQGYDAKEVLKVMSPSIKR